MGVTEVILILWGIGVVLGICVSLPFCIERDLDTGSTMGVMMILICAPIINIIYPIYIITKYYKVNYKDFL